MAQNKSHAVMAQRSEADDSLDFFPTPPWATRALCEHVIDVRGKSVWEPAAGQGHMTRALNDCGTFAYGSDIADHGGHFPYHDFLMPYLPIGIPAPVDWIITNPPFRLAEQFILRGLEIATIGVAVLVRSVFIESVGRYERLFSVRPPSIVAQFVERVPMVKGRVDKDASTATSYCWLVWNARTLQTALKWIPPCRARLEKPGDYD